MFPNLQNEIRSKKGTSCYGIIVKKGTSLVVFIENDKRGEDTGNPAAKGKQEYDGD